MKRQVYISSQRIWSDVWWQRRQGQERWEEKEIGAINAGESRTTLGQVVPETASVQVALTPSASSTTAACCADKGDTV